MSRNRPYLLDVVLLAVVAALPTTLLSGRMMLEWRYATWSETARVLSTTLIVVLPVITLAVVVIVGKAPPGAQFVRRAAVASSTGWIVGALPALIWAFRTAGDTPRLLFLLVPVAWVAATATGTAVLASVVPRGVALLAVVAFWTIAILADLVTGQRSRWLLFLPFSGLSGEPSGEVVLNAWLAVVRLSVAAAIVVGVLSARLRRRTGAWATAGVVAALVAFPVPVYAAADPKVVCSGTAIRVCLLAEHRQDLPAVQAIVDRMAAEAGPALFPFTLASEVAANSPGTIQLAVGSQRSASLARDVTGQLAGKIARIDRCAPTPGQRVDPAYRLVAFWFVEQSGLPLAEFAQDAALEPRLAAWRGRPSQVTTGLRALAGQLDSCQLTIDELPPGSDQ
jgi:hypothetical protein